MISREIIIDILKKNRLEIQKRFTARKIGLFGSYVRNEATSGSDIDLLVEFDIPTYDNYMDLKFYLEDLLKTPVDLVLADTIKPRLKQYISQEIVYA